MNNIKTWMQGETFAKDFLIKKGFIILEQNFRTKLGEIDIIALDPKQRQIKLANDKVEKEQLNVNLKTQLNELIEDTIVFVEVKARENAFLWNPLDSIDKHKQFNIKQVANFYLGMKNLLDKSVRFDVITVSGDEINHIENAFI